MSSPSYLRIGRLVAACGLASLALLVVPTSGQTLLLHWRLDESSGTTAADASGSGHTGSTTGATAWTPGVRSGALDLTTGAKLQVNSLLGQPASFTVAAWVNVDSVDGNGGVAVTVGDHITLVMDEPTYNGGRPAIGFTYSGSSYRFATGINAATGTGWHHYAGVFDDATDTLRLYVDGVLVSELITTDSVDWAPLGSTTCVGSISYPVSGYAMDGRIDDVRVYDQALSGEEVAALYGLVGHWKLEESSGTTAVDSSGAGNDGAYESSPTLGASAARGRGVEFSADSAHDRLSIPATVLDGATQVSVAWWMKTSKTGEQAILSGASDSYANANSFLVFFPNATTFRPYLEGQSESLSIESIADGRWRHCVFTHDRATGESVLYIDGAPAGTLSFPPRTGGIQITTGGLIIAEEQDSVGGSFVVSQAFQGVLDDFRIYNYLLTEAEIAELYGLVLHLPLDEQLPSYAAAGTPTPDLSGLDNDGAYYGACIPGDFSPYPGETGVQFDDPAAVRVPHNDSLVLSDWNTFSLAAWVWPSRSVSQSFDIVGKHDESGRSAYLMRYEADGRIGVYINEDNVTGGSDEWEGYSSSYLLDQQPRHVCVTYDGSHVRWYIDGQLDREEAVSETIGDEGHDVVVGDLNASGNEVQGVDDVRVYNRAIFPNEVAELYGMVGHWRLDEASGSTAADSSGSGADGVWSGGPTVGVSAVRQQGVEATDAAQQMVVAPTSSLNALAVDGADLSVALWIRPTAPDNFDRSVLHKGPTAQERTPNLTLNFGDNRVQYAISADGNWNAGATSTEGLPTNKWSHVVLVKEDRQYRLYINGQLDSVRDVNGESYGNSGPLYLGASPFRDGDPGRFDDLRVYNRALSQAEIADVYGLVGWWKLDETTGTTAFDSSGKGNHATLVGGSWVEAGQDGGAVQLDGDNDYLRTHEFSNSNWGSEITLAGWVRADDLPDVMGVIVKGSSNLAFGLTYDDDTSIGLRANDGAGVYGGAGWLSHGSDSVLTVNQWRHLAASYSDGVATFYVDGVLDSTQSVPGVVIGGTSEPLSLGVWNGLHFSGQLDDLRIYNRAITAEEAKAIGGLPPPGIRIIRWVEVR